MEKETHRRMRVYLRYYRRDRVYKRYFMEKVDYFLDERDKFKGVISTEVHIFKKKVDKQKRYKRTKIVNKIVPPKNKSSFVDRLSSIRVDYLYSK